MEIAAAEGRDRPAVREIWLACFPDDTPETAEYFLKRLWAPGRCLVGRLDGRAVTMAFLLPAELVTASGVLPLRYVFAAATLPAYQGRGCFSSLLRHAHALAAAEGAAALFLRPAELFRSGVPRAVGPAYLLPPVTRGLFQREGGRGAPPSSLPSPPPASP